MSAFGELAFSMAMRDTIQRMVREEVDQQRPKYRYGTVTSIDHVAAKCDVIYTGEAHAVRVNMGTIRPVRKGQIVRIEGLGTDKFITDVIGQWGSGHLSGTVSTYHSSGPVRVTWDGDATESGPYKHVMRGYRPRGGDRVTMIPTEDGIMIAPSSVDLSLPGTVNHRQVPQYYNVRDTVGFVNNWTDYQPAGHATFFYNDDRDPNNWYSDYMAAGFAKTAAGIVKLRGLIKRSGSPAGGELLFTLPAGYRPAGRMSFAAQSGTGHGSFDIDPAGQLMYRGGSVDFISLDNITFPSADVAPTSAWIELGTTAVPFQNGWSHYGVSVGGDWPRVSYFVDQNNWVHFRGLLHRSAGQPTFPSRVFTLPLAISAPRSGNIRTMGYGGSGNVNPAGSTGQDFNLKNPTLFNYVSVDGVCWPTPSAEVLGRWLFPGPLLNGFTSWETQNTKGWFAVPTVYKTLDGLAQIIGTVKNGSNSQGNVVVLPATYRPKATLLFPGLGMDNQMRLDLQQNGTIFSSTYAPAAGGYVGFDYMTYIAEH